MLLLSYLLYGFDSPIFAMAFILALIVMYDATGVRWAAGLHAKAINYIVEYLADENAKDKAQLNEMIPKLNESLGHRMTEVVCGAALGAAIALIAHFCFLKSESIRFPLTGAFEAFSEHTHQIEVKKTRTGMVLVRVFLKCFSMPLFPMCGRGCFISRVNSSGASGRGRPHADLAFRSGLLGASALLTCSTASTPRSSSARSWR